MTMAQEESVNQKSQFQQTLSSLIELCSFQQLQLEQQEFL
jgi:hypothetical protein